MIGKGDNQNVSCTTGLVDNQSKLKQVRSYLKRPSKKDEINRVAPE